MQFYTSRGRWRSTRSTDVDLKLDEKVPVELLKPILPYFPTSSVEMAALPQFALEGGVPRPLGAPLVDRMNRFENESRVFYGKHASVLDNIYNHIADENHAFVLTLGDIAAKALAVKPNSLSNPEKYAIHKALQRQPFYVIPNSIPSMVESYRVRSKRQSKSIDNVVLWVRKWQNEHARGATGRSSFTKGSHFGDFVAKTRRLVLQSRESRKPNLSFSLGPSSQTQTNSPVEASSGVPVEAWTNADRVILAFMLLWTTPQGGMESGALNTAGSTILRSLGLYEGYPLNRATGYLFLQEVGYISPWENLYVLGEQLELPGHGFFNNSDRLAKLVDNHCNHEASASKSLPDRMKNFRKDWGDLPVYCVDSASTSEVDDGISIERVVGGPPDTFWIRVHVANPSAFLSPSNPLAKAAAQTKQTFYTPERAYYMLPPSVTQSHFSLAPGRPALTISAKVNMHGDILETDIVNSRVNNVLHMTPESVQRLLGVDEKAPLMDLVVGDVPAEVKRLDIQVKVPEEHQESFRLLQKLLAARRDRRIEKGGSDDYTPYRAMPLVSIPNKSLWSFQTSESCHYGSDPSIRLSAHMRDPFQVMESTKHDLVSHAMLLAGEVAAKWCKEREIPAIFAASAYPHNNPLVSPSVREQTNSLSPGKLPRSFASVQPAPHTVLGMDQYLRCTSPLRRYSDMVAHWQIEAFLREEKSLPFSPARLNTHIARANWQVSLIQRAQNRARDFWACQLFNRALNFGEATLPETFQCFVVSELTPLGGPRTEERSFIGSLLPFRLRCLLQTTQETADLKRGDLVDIKLSSVDVYDTLITADVVRLVKRPDQGAIPPAALFL